MMSSLLERGSIRLVTDFLPDSHALYEYLVASVVWDTRIRARKSASFGVPYNYSGIEWPQVPIPDAIAPLPVRTAGEVGFEPNNCLANYYTDGKSSMGFHSDSTEALEHGTGIAVVSLGTERTITFHRISDKTVTESYRLSSGSLLWMCPEMQAEWRHAVLADRDISGGRISLTFRRVKA
ncbi:2og-fe oxygenase : 2OG-Fe(II) oxygenase family oxidoreductase OS=Pseudomonas sp. CF161 GN=CF161_01435 PE=4 SV=1: 2OG-FeII_Oxy_2 [Gemmata massiliana]|uniref:Fe2OG dioxygenase domain-containing protein n=1 Tax=Gemmata massiliana TaxID=1210884 RepID=A0A6P2DKC3_9BACT|nr:alpha-ketoglutarate-dependent dioxygenase AlkB [Gemmata massiliana]VTS03060.1 2og-fe oxygenase : 2OG-Fe(II) oxygenase family oxidoreductase OS=Pseudomonas sp. CF161 GN=CF161_01435 PE=4 SV=1: 2OG-FeII_Oxy_2 [Gemmata massiliana]